MSASGAAVRAASWRASARRAAPPARSPPAPHAPPRRERCRPRAPPPASLPHAARSRVAASFAAELSAAQLAEAASALQCVASLVRLQAASRAPPHAREQSVTACALLAARGLLSPASADALGPDGGAAEEPGWGRAQPAAAASPPAAREEDPLATALGEATAHWVASADAPAPAVPAPPPPGPDAWAESVWAAAGAPLQPPARGAEAPRPPPPPRAPAAPLQGDSSALPPLLLLALLPEPRRALLSASLASLRCALRDSGDWRGALQAAVPAAAAAWAAASPALAPLRRAEEATAFAAAARAAADEALSPEALGGRGSLYGPLAAALAGGGARADPAAAPLAALLLQDAAVVVAEAVAAAYCQQARGEAAEAAASGGFARRAALLPRLRATRALERFRNEVALRRWTHARFGGVRELAEDRQPLWGFGRAAGGLRRRELPLQRRAELDGLTGLRRWVGLALEAADVAGPLLQRAGRRASDALSFLLVQLIGRALGLVARGVRQSLGSSSQV